MTSNGGALLLREVRRGLDLAHVPAGCIRDGRAPPKVIHSHASMIDARIGAIACGHEDCDDLDVLHHDPALKMFCETAPEADAGLASQPALSRLEHALGWWALARIGLKMIDAFCDSFGRDKVRRFLQTPCAAKSWRRARRVIARVKATPLGSDTRFSVTNIAGGRAKHLYETICCARSAAWRSS